MKKGFLFILIMLIFSSVICFSESFIINGEKIELIDFSGFEHKKIQFEKEEAESPKSAGFELNDVLVQKEFVGNSPAVFTVFIESEIQKIGRKWTEKDFLNFRNGLSKTISKHQNTSNTVKININDENCFSFSKIIESEDKRPLLVFKSYLLIKAEIIGIEYSVFYKTPDDYDNAKKLVKSFTNEFITANNSNDFQQSNEKKSLGFFDFLCIISLLFFCFYVFYIFYDKNKNKKKYNNAPKKENYNSTYGDYNMISQQEIEKKLGPYCTGPQHFEQYIDYASGLFGVDYNFKYYWRELDIRWETGWGRGFNCPNEVSNLFSKYNLNMSDLKEDFNNLPSERKELKEYLQANGCRTKTVEVFFNNEKWRRDYWFCKNSNKLFYSFYLKDEVRLLIQFEPAKIMLELKMDTENTTREYVIVNLSGKKGVYDYSGIGSAVWDRLEEISNYFSQFGYGFSNSQISEIVEQLKKGYSAKGSLLNRKKISPQQYNNLLDLNEDYAGWAHTRDARMIPMLPTCISMAGDISIINNTEVIQRYYEYLEKYFSENSIPTNCLIDFIKETIRQTEYCSDQRRQKLIENIVTFHKDTFENPRAAALSSIYFALAYLTERINGDMVRAAVDFCSYFNISPDEVIDKIKESGYSRFFEEPDDIKEDDDQSEAEHFYDGDRNNPNWRPTSYYLTVLGLEETATWEDVIEAKKSWLLLLHPDNFSGNEKKRIQAEEKSKQINIAVDILRERKID